MTPVIVVCDGCDSVMKDPETDRSISFADRDSARSAIKLTAWKTAGPLIHCPGCQIAKPPKREPWCWFCGVEMSTAHEVSMGLYCHHRDNATGMHEFVRSVPKDRCDHCGQPTSDRQPRGVGQLCAKCAANFDRAAAVAAERCQSCGHPADQHYWKAGESRWGSCISVSCECSEYVPAPAVQKTTDSRTPRRRPNGPPQVVENVTAEGAD